MVVIKRIACYHVQWMILFGIDFKGYVIVACVDYMLSKECMNGGKSSNERDRL